MSLRTSFCLHWVGHAAQEALGSRLLSTAAVRGLLCWARGCQGSPVGKSAGLAQGGALHQQGPAVAVLRAGHHPPTPAWKWAARPAVAAQEARRLRTLAAAVHLSHTDQLLRSVICDQVQAAHSYCSEAAKWQSLLSHSPGLAMLSPAICPPVYAGHASGLPFTWRWWACRAEGWTGSSAWWTWVRWPLLGSTCCTWLPHSSCRACTFVPDIAPCSLPPCMLMLPGLLSCPADCHLSEVPCLAAPACLQVLLQVGESLKLAGQQQILAGTAALLLVPECLQTATKH